MLIGSASSFLSYEWKLTYRINPNIWRGFFFQIQLLRNVGLLIFRSKSKYEEDEYEEFELTNL
jgi:hypothetical protein